MPQLNKGSAAAAQPKKVRASVTLALPFGRGEGESSAALWRAEVQGQGDSARSGGTSKMPVMKRLRHATGGRQLLQLFLRFGG